MRDRAGTRRPSVDPQLIVDAPRLRPAQPPFAGHAFGADHLLFGTDYPYCNVEEFGRHLTYLDECRFDAATLDHVRGGGAAALLGLPTRV
jgi:predicted TIM-barrel fold metal-dependent hydrolase